MDIKIISTILRTKKTQDYKEKPPYNNSLETSKNLTKKTRKISLKLQGIKNKEGLRQLNMFIERKENINNIISDYFNSNEITEIKYRDILNETYFFFIESLENYFLVIKSNEIIKNNSLLKSIKTNKSHFKLANKALKKHFDLSKNNRVITNKLLFNNEKALLKLDVFTAELISINNAGSNKLKLANENLLNSYKQLNNRG